MNHWLGYLTEHVGKKRLESILKSLKIKKKMRLLEGDLAKIITTIANVKRNEMQEVLLGLHAEVLTALSPRLSKEILSYKEVEDLPPKLFTTLYKVLAYPFLCREGVVSSKELEGFWQKAAEEMTPETYWQVKEGLTLTDETVELELVEHYERLVCYYAEKNLIVGSYVPASKEHPDCFYRVMAELITGGGQLGFFLVPATKTMKIPPIRLTRGSPITPLKLDFISHAITDLEPDIGRRGYESGLPYQPFIDEIFQEPCMEIGFSIGGTIAQWRASENPKNISSLWLFKSPGVPKFVWENFNKKVATTKKSMDLHIFRARRDLVPYVGEYCLGYKAPSSVKVYLYLVGTSRMNPHLYDLRDPKNREIERVEGEAINDVLNNEGHSFLEKGRKGVGRHILVPLLEKAKKVFHLHTTGPIVSRVGLWFEERPSTETPYTSIRRYKPTS